MICPPISKRPFGAALPLLPFVLLLFTAAAAAALAVLISTGGTIVAAADSDDEYVPCPQEIFEFEQQADFGARPHTLVETRPLRYEYMRTTIEIGALARYRAVDDEGQAFVYRACHSHDTKALRRAFGYMYITAFAAFDYEPVHERPNADDIGRYRTHVGNMLRYLRDVAQGDDIVWYTAPDAAADGDGAYALWQESRSLILMTHRDVIRHIASSDCPRCWRMVHHVWEKRIQNVIDE